MGGICFMALRNFFKNIFIEIKFLIVFVVNFLTRIISHIPQNRHLKFFCAFKKFKL